MFAEATQMTQDERDNYRVNRALAVTRVLRGLGWVWFTIGILSLVGILALLALGRIDMEQAFLVAVGTVLLTLMSGAATYSSGMNLAVSAARLNRAVAKSSPSRPGKNE